MTARPGKPPKIEIIVHGKLGRPITVLFPGPRPEPAPPPIPEADTYRTVVTHDPPITLTFRAGTLGSSWWSRFVHSIRWIWWKLRGSPL